MPPKAMTANPVRPARYRPGKAVAESASSSEGSEAESGAEKQPQKSAAPKQAPPKATSFPADGAKKVASNLKNLDLNERRKRAETAERARREKERLDRAREEKEAGFVTESESGEDEEEEEETIDDRINFSAKPTAASRKQRKQPPTGTTSSSPEEGGSSEDESDSSASPPPKLIRPVFLSRTQREAVKNVAAEPSAEEKAEAEAERRAKERDAIVQERLELDLAAKAAGKKGWDDDDPSAHDVVDDTDGLDPELERQQWVARELGRLKRTRAQLEEREAEIAEVERRKNLTPAEREAEDREHVDKQKAEKDGRNKAGFMARYHHRGAFYREEGEEAGLANRDLMGAEYEGREGMMEALPEYLQVRDATMVGRKGRTKYKDLKSEDTGSWGRFDRDGRSEHGGGGRGGALGTGKDAGPFVADERFRPDRPGSGATGANAGVVSERDRARKRAYGDEGRDDTKRPRYSD